MWICSFCFAFAKIKQILVIYQLPSVLEQHTWRKQPTFHHLIVFTWASVIIPFSTWQLEATQRGNWCSGRGHTPSGALSTLMFFLLILTSWLHFKHCKTCNSSHFTSFDRVFCVFVDLKMYLNKGILVKGKSSVSTTFTKIAQLLFYQQWLNGLQGLCLYRQNKQLIFFLFCEEISSITLVGWLHCGTNLPSALGKYGVTRCAVGHWYIRMNDNSY